MNAMRSNSTSSERYVTRKWLGVGKFLLQEAALGLQPGLTDRVEHKVAELMEQKPKARIVEPRCELEDVLRYGRPEHDEHHNNVAKHCVGFFSQAIALVYRFALLSHAEITSQNKIGLALVIRNRTHTAHKFKIILLHRANCIRGELEHNAVF